ncbi:reverse transcriptase family protein [Pectobacterium polaris]|uniref:reverse transcriptase family protein n=1 Tax=Pectobacterium polaris TaxID=2042057 RepID=UPI001CF0E3C9|nr:reverse transcriptase family protein [Pectobacterium polaris]MCA6952793.1 reverse transcriptase family protein [Pectobacterium polaris]
MWSSQNYKKQGLAKGFSESLLTKAITQSELLICSQNNLPSILSLSHLAKRTGVEYELLRGFVMRNATTGVEHFEIYKKFSIRKRSGNRRFIHVPTPKLMRTQRWLSEHILEKLPVHVSSQAFKKGNSIKKCASRHCGAKWLIKIDIADFFSSISEIQVYRVFRSLNYQPLVAFELARICTVGTHNNSPRGVFSNWKILNPNNVISVYNQKLLGYLPQGAPTSPLLANIIMNDCDKALQTLAQRNDLIYTRYSDDLTFSTTDKQFDRSKAKEFVFNAYQIISKYGFRPQFRKTTIVPPGSKKIVLGLNVDSDLPRLAKHTRDSIRQHLYYLEKMGPVQHAFNRQFDSVWGLKMHLRGLIDYANMIEPDFAKSCLLKFNSIEWPV